MGARQLECKKKDGSLFTSAIRSLYLEDEGSVVKVTLWGQKVCLYVCVWACMCVFEIA